MRRTARQRRIVPRRQTGATLLAFMLVLISAASFMLLSRLNAATQQAYRNQVTLRVLEEAKEALIGYALTYAESHSGQPQGYLPCPDTDDDGSAESSCSSTGKSVLGRLPWQTLKISPLRDADGECLWYAVSGAYKSGPKSSLTSDTDGYFLIENAQGTTIMGTSADGRDRVIAVVFAPGAITGTQNRGIANEADRTECGSQNSADAVRVAANYLETLQGVNNAAGTKSGAFGGAPGSEALPTDKPSVFITSPVVRDPTDRITGSIVFNDTISVITPDDFDLAYERMDRWVADRVRRCVDAYADANGHRYPWAARLNPGSAPSFEDGEDERFGRIPQADLEKTSDSSGGSMSETWTSDPQYPTYSCFDYSSGAVASKPDGSWWWWDKWRQIVLYAVDVEYAPDGAALAPPQAVSVDGTLTPAAVIVSGRRLTDVSQSRTTNTQMGAVSNYLEDDNVTGGGSGQIPPGDPAFVTGDATATFNDVSCRVDTCP